MGLLDSAPDMLKETLARNLKDAMRARETVRLGAIRMLQSAITAEEKKTGQPLADDALVAIVQRQAKQRRDSIAQFENGGREDLAERERAELTWIEMYLPEQASDEDIHRIVQEIVTSTGASTMKDMGRVMGTAMQQLKGVADGNRVRQVVQQLLSA
ncbi:MAG: GatB/YqeY domain-containing protein [Bacteroidota bacterium]